MSAELDLFGNPVPVDAPRITVKAQPVAVPLPEKPLPALTEDFLRTIRPFSFFKESATSTWILHE